MTPFVKSFVASTITGMLSFLKGCGAAKQIEIHVKGTGSKKIDVNLHTLCRQEQRLLRRFLGYSNDVRNRPGTAWWRIFLKASCTRPTLQVHAIKKKQISFKSPSKYNAFGKIERRQDK